MTAIDPSTSDPASPQPQVIAVVIPAYRVERQIGRVLDHLPDYVSHIIVVDDVGGDRTAEIVRAHPDPRITLISHSRNQGVGGAVMTGYAKALDLGADIVVKMDGDDQMDPAFLPDLLAPLLSWQADYTKGNRFTNLEALRQMPVVRRIGNTALTFMLKLASGYWTVCDPTNGYTALRREAMQALDFSRIDRRYFFESSMLIQLNIIGAVVRDVPIPARYGDERSSLRIRRVLVEFPLRLAVGLLGRLVHRHMLLEFSPLALFVLMGVPSLLFGTLFGLYRWYVSIATRQTQSTGTVILAMLPVLLGIQFLIQALAMDMYSEPRIPISERLRTSTKIARQLIRTNRPQSADDHRRAPRQAV